jgi:hypothetical protein
VCKEKVAEEDVLEKVKSARALQINALTASQLVCHSDGQSKFGYIPQQSKTEA